MTEHKPKTEFSKKLLYVIFTVAGIIMAFSMYMIWETKDTSPLSYLIPSVFTLVSVSVGFYYNKAKMENAIKLKKIYGEELVEKAKQLVEESEYDSYGNY